MKKILENNKIDTLNYKQDKNLTFLNKGDFSMKKFIYKIVSMVMVGAVLFSITACGTAKSSKSSNSSSAIKASKSEVAKQPSKDAKGNVIDEKDKEIIANGDKAKALADVTSKKFVETLYNCTPDNIDKNFETLNSISATGKMFGDQADAEKKDIASSPLTLISYTCDDSVIGKYYKLEGDTSGKEYYSIDETFTVIYTDGGTKKTDKLDLSLLYNVKNDKAFTICGVAMKQQ